MRTERGVPVARPFAWARGFGHRSLATSDQEALDAVQKPGPPGGFCPVFYYPLEQMPPRGLPSTSTREVQKTPRALWRICLSHQRGRYRHARGREHHDGGAGADPIEEVDDVLIEQPHAA